MGICVSSHIITVKGGSMKWRLTAKIVHLDGRLQELSEPIRVSHILSQNPNCFLSSSDAMYVGSNAPHVPGDEEVELGQIYFLMPISKSHSPLSLQDLCALAIKASTALETVNMRHTDIYNTKTISFLMKLKNVR